MVFGVVGCVCDFSVSFPEWLFRRGLDRPLGITALLLNSELSPNSETRVRCWTEASSQENIAQNRFGGVY